MIGTQIDFEIARDERTWKKDNRIGVVAYDKNSNTVCFYNNPTDDLEDYFYWLPFDEVKTYRGYNDWFAHLSHKTWFTSGVKYQLQDVLEKLGQYGNFDGTEHDPPTKS